MSVVLVEAPPRRRRYGASDVLVEARALRRALTAAVRAGRSPTVIAKQAGVQVGGVRSLLDGSANYATEALYLRLRPLLQVHEPRFVLGVRPGHVPGELLVPILREALGRSDIEAVAAHCGIPSRRLALLRDGHTKAVNLRTADRIVTRLEGPDRWRTDPALRRWYWASCAST